MANRFNELKVGDLGLTDKNLFFTVEENNSSHITCNVENVGIVTFDMDGKFLYDTWWAGNLEIKIGDKIEITDGFNKRILNINNSYDLFHLKNIRSFVKISIIEQNDDKVTTAKLKLEIDELRKQFKLPKPLNVKIGDLCICKKGNILKVTDILVDYIRVLNLSSLKDNGEIDVCFLNKFGTLHDIEVAFVQGDLVTLNNNRFKISGFSLTEKCKVYISHIYDNQIYPRTVDLKEICLSNN